MASEMIERIAHAIHETTCGECSPRAALDAAPAVLAAMRRPTEAMKVAARDKYDLAVYYSMIDAALNDGDAT